MEKTSKPSEMRQFTEEADATTIQIAIGDVFEVCLNENPTTGFRWNLEATGEPACILLNDRFSGHGHHPGGQGNHHWNFKAVAPGTAAIRLSYARKWQKGPPARTFRLMVRAGG